MIRPAVCGAVILASAIVGAFEPMLDRRAIEEAIYVGQSRIEMERTRFHVPYRVQVGRPPVDWIDVITPFHRVELAAETNARAGGRQFGQRQALEVLKDAPTQVDLIVEMSFHPLNTFVGIPLYQVTLLEPAGTQLEPRRIDRYPRFGPRPESTGPSLPASNAMPILGSGQPVLGGTMIAGFDGAKLDRVGQYQVIVQDGKTELARARIDLARMR